MPMEMIDLSGFMPSTVGVRFADGNVVEISSDQPPALVARGTDWVNACLLTYDGTTKGAEGVDLEEGYAIVQEMAGGRDMHEIGVLGMVRLLTFFRDGTLAKMQEIFSKQPSRSPESSTGESPSETSSEAQPSSESA